MRSLVNNVQAAYRWVSRAGAGFNQGLEESVLVWANRTGAAVKTLALHPEVINQELHNTIKGALTVGMAAYGADQDAIVLYVKAAAADKWRQLAEADPYELGRSLGHDAPVIILTEGAGELVFAARGARYTDEFVDFLDDLPRYKSKGPATLDDALDAELDAALDSGQARAGTMVRFTDEGGPLSGSGPKQGQGDIWYHDNINVPGVGPNGKTVQVRTHSPNPNAPEGSHSRSSYTTQINTKEGLYLLPDGTWKKLADMTPEERAAAHYPAGN